MKICASIAWEWAIYASFKLQLLIKAFSLIILWILWPN